MEEIRKGTYPSISETIMYSSKFGADWQRMRSKKIFFSYKNVIQQDVKKKNSMKSFNSEQEFK